MSTSLDTVERSLIGGSGIVRPLCEEERKDTVHIMSTPVPFDKANSPTFIVFPKSYGKNNELPLVYKKAESAVIPNDDTWKQRRNQYQRTYMKTHYVNVNKKGNGHKTTQQHRYT